MQRFGLRCYSLNDSGILGEKKFRGLLTGVKPTTFQVVLQTFYHCAIGDRLL